ncbi:amino acid ABC transporter substrate-binding protein [Phytoactinopolyspora endophytica]|uniref:amino acid ABC transporter substrate-binding protein n=1 Tax=Phytoactinopolyspora endophytica TaxID=1642495 RepID=UPI0013EC7EA4|nr:amino acid ABC transporter substrate-binding protein [Phytoactinopolyspora endophytica]
MAALALVLAACGGDDDNAAQPEPEGAEGAPSGEPIVVGSSLSLTGAFGPTAAIHQVAGEQFIERLNEEGGLLGRPVEWLVLDDESDQAQVADLYERLISQEQVDLIMSPYATPNILSAAPIAERHGFVLPQHTAVLAPLLPYRCQFPAWSIGPEPNVYVPEQLYDAVASLPDPPERIAILTHQSGSTDFISYGSPEVDGVGAVSIAEDRGLDVVLEVRYPPGTTDWAPIAAQVRDADPDLVVNNGLGVEPVELIEAMEQLDYRPPLLFSLFPAPGPLLGVGEGVLSVSTFEPNEAVLEQYEPEVREIVDDFESRAEDAGVPYTAFETQAASSWTAWEILVAAVEGAGEIDHEAMCDYLIENGADTTLSGELTFDPEVNNFWPSNQGLKQVQDGEWVMVWPEDRAAAQLRLADN